MTRDESPTFVFHIGLERTGSTSFQRFCTTNAAQLQRSGILYPTKSPAFRVDNHGPLVAGYLAAHCADPDYAIHSTLAAKATVLQSLFKNVAKQSPDIVLISSEHFSSRFEPADIEALAQDFAGRRCKILLVVRDHRQRFFSAYATSVMSGRHLTVEEYAEEVLAPENHYLRYRAIIEMWEGAFGKDAIVVKPYRSDDGLIHSLLESVSSRPVAVSSSKAYDDNRSLGPSCTEALRLANLALASRFCGPSRSYWSWLQKRYCEVRMKRWLVAAAGTRNREPWHLGAAHLARLDAIAAEDTAWLAENYGVTLSASPSGPRQPQSAQNPLDATQILAQALQDRILGQWNLVDAAMPALIPVARLWHRWRMKGL
ncbi:hypothetical protein [Beijerinckia sp. L45]|uniref:hypothetical protein n=1 Tax=Beijerinckia sp. L45 TaxID=1641855 RepID=UPI00131B8D06|nr:hypothetical protein [Beijerinckia sp. L45]